MAPPGTDFDVSFWRDVQASAQAQALCAMRPGALCHAQACVILVQSAGIGPGL